MFIKIGGIPASGKSTIANFLVGILKEQGVCADLVHGGEIMAQVLGVTMEELRNMPEKDKADARNKMYEIMYALDREDPNVVRLRDAHFCMLDRDSGEFLIAPLQKGDLQQMKAMIVLDVPPEEIIRRINHDRVTRPDRNFNLQAVKREIEAELTTAQEQARTLGLSLIVVKNSGRSPQQTCQEIATELKRVLFDPEIRPKKSGAEIISKF